MKEDLELMKTELIKVLNIIQKLPKDRALSIAITKLEETFMWIDYCLRDKGMLPPPKWMEEEPTSKKYVPKVDDERSVI